METSVKINGHDIHYVDVGTGKPLLLVMGLGGHIAMWKPLMGQLTNRRIIAFDSPGTGLSSTPSVPVGISELAKLTADLIDHLEFDKIDVLGYSYGGFVAQQLAYEYPEYVDKLILVATHVGVGSKPPGLLPTLALMSPIRYHTKLPMGAMKAIYGGRIGRDERVRDHVYKIYQGHPPSQYGYLMQILGMLGWSSLGFLNHINKKTLIIGGGEDPLCPPENIQLLGNIPNSRVKISPKDGHLLLLDNAKETSELIKDHLN